MGTITFPVHVARDDEIVVDLRSLREKLRDLRYRVFDVVGRAVDAVKRGAKTAWRFVVNKTLGTGVTKLNRMNFILRALQILLGITGFVAWYVVFLVGLILSLEFGGLLGMIVFLIIYLWVTYLVIDVVERKYNTRTSYRW